MSQAPINLAQLFEQKQTLPALPRVVQELISSFNNEIVATDYIASRIASDQVLCARLLRMANSAYYQAPQSVATVEAAIALLGFVNVRTLVISIALTGSFSEVPGIDLNRFWRHSLYTALAARHLAGPTGQNGDLAFTIGLMHDIGLLVMRLALPEAMNKVDQLAPLLSPQRIEVERAIVGYSHDEVGAELTRRWSFPSIFSLTIAASESPLDLTPLIPLAALIHVADWRALATENKLDATALLATWPVDVAASISLQQNLALQDFPAWDVLSAGMMELIA